MTGFEIAGRQDAVRIYEGPAGDADNPSAVRFSRKPFPGGWHHFRFQLNYVCRDKDLTVEHGYYFRIHGKWSLPTDAEPISGLFASLMWRTAQDVEAEVRRRGAESTHAFDWILARAQSGVRGVVWP